MSPSISHILANPLFGIQCIRGYKINIMALYIYPISMFFILFFFFLGGGGGGDGSYIFSE